MSTFKLFAQRVNHQLNKMGTDELYVAIENKDSLWDHYLKSFPEGSNPIFRERTEYDCSCCRNFVKNFGGVVSIKKGKIVSVWDVDTKSMPDHLAVVAKAMSEFVHANANIISVFRTKEQKYGAESNTETLVNGEVLTWNHFWGKVQPRHRSMSPAADASSNNQIAKGIQRAVTELTSEALETVKDLICSNSLYRGSEHSYQLEIFEKALNEYKVSTNKDLYHWVAEAKGYGAAAIRNTVIGTLLQDLSEGVDLERAVSAYETKVAPTNYKRPKALVTPAMINAAAKTIVELGYEDSIQRRHANISDINVNDVLWTGAEMRTGEQNDFLSNLVKSVPANKGKISTQSIKVDDFLKSVASKASTLELMLGNSQQKNFVTVTAPLNTDSKHMFKWDNNFGWSYDGNITDSITERVKNAGGDVNAKLRFSLAWFNKDDLDLHCDCPDGHIYFGNKQGILDVDMNVTNPIEGAVENLSFSSPLNGEYSVWVNNWSQRTLDKRGFILQVVDENGVTEYSYDKVVNHDVEFVFQIKDGVVVDVKLPKGVTSNTTPIAKWGVETNTWTQIRTIMNSPNYWGDNSTGLKHWFFILKDCLAEGDVRGFYNEFLSNDLSVHRKAFELISSKALCQPTDDQLSGVGFVQTKGEKVLIRVDGVKIYEVEI